MVNIKAPTPSWKALITDCFAATTFMSLATYGPEGLWVNPLYFSWDKRLSLYFISELDCCHMRNIHLSPDVACTIYPTNQAEDVFGAYVKGRAHFLTEANDKKRADNIYYGRVYPNDPDATAKNKDTYRLNPNWHFIRIDISKLWYFDTRYFDEKRVEVPLVELFP